MRTLSFYKTLKEVIVICQSKNFIIDFKIEIQSLWKFFTKEFIPLISYFQRWLQFEDGKKLISLIKARRWWMNLKIWAFLIRKSLVFALFVFFGFENLNIEVARSFKAYSSRSTAFRDFEVLWKLLGFISVELQCFERII